MKSFPLGFRAGLFHRKNLGTCSQILPVLVANREHSDVHFSTEKREIPNADCQYQHSLHSLPKQRVRWISWPNFSWGMKLYLPQILSAVSVEYNTLHFLT